jgi:hypothetical protein
MKSIINIYKIGQKLSKNKESISATIYPHSNFSDIKAYCLNEKISLIKYIEKFEPRAT